MSKIIYKRLIILLLIFTMLHVLSSFQKSLLHPKITKTWSQNIQSFSQPFLDKTMVEIPSSKIKIDYHSKLYFIGSCFSEVISSEMKKRKFKTFTNPQGIVFNPLSIGNAIENSIDSKVFTLSDLFQDYQEKSLYHSWNHHSSFSGYDVNTMLEKMNNQMKESRNQLQSCDFFIITFGSAFVHRLKANGRVVSNCHKQPSTLFTKELLSSETIIHYISNILSNCFRWNPNMHIIFTVSPVRHTKEGIQQNMLSKSILLYSVHSILQNFPTNKISYFPSYEIMMDELRDYRWYAEDMIHPSTVAESIIFQRFIQTYCNDHSTITMMKEVENILKRVDHRPIVAIPSSESYLKHVESTEQLIHAIESKYSQLSFDEEKQKLKRK